MKLNYFFCATVFTWKDTVPFIPPITQGQVVKVYDGDTITIASKLPYDHSPLYRFSVRLRGIDAPEMNGKTDEEKEAAQASQKVLEALILYKNVTLEKVGREKYGRLLAVVFYEEININEWMLADHHAVKYNGGSKNASKPKNI